MKELKNGRSEMLPCNIEVLRDIFGKAGYDPHDIAEDLGYNKTYFNKVWARKSIGRTCVSLLAERYNIQPEQYGVVGYYKDAAQEFVRTSVKKAKVLEMLGKGENKDKIELTVMLDRDILKKLIKEAVLEAFDEL